jgi:hypothetical protein
MKRTNTEALSDLLKQFIASNHLEHGLNCARLINAWEEAVGKMIAQSTLDLDIYNRKLYVKLRSSIVRNELFMIKTGLIKRLNELAQADVIDDIIFK